ncbi:MAG: signal peptidase I [Candidatus Buchananbacteria bacterium]
MIFFKKPKAERFDPDAMELSFGKQVLIFIWEIVKIVVISLAIIIPVRYYLIKPFYVKGASMEPNFYNHEYLIIDEISYRFSQPQRGDTVVIRYPYDPSQYFIKRVIGLPGEKIKISASRVSIYNSQYPDGLVLHEPYLPESLKTLGEVEVTLKSNEYYVLGDNRVASLDSRVFGPVSREFVVGKTLLRGWPIYRIGLVNYHVNY